MLSRAVPSTSEQVRQASNQGVHPSCFAAIGHVAGALDIRDTCDVRDSGSVCDVLDFGNVGDASDALRASSDPVPENGGGGGGSQPPPPDIGDIGDVADAPDVYLLQRFLDFRNFSPRR